MERKGEVELGKDKGGSFGEMDFKIQFPFLFWNDKLWENHSKFTTVRQKKNRQYDLIMVLIISSLLIIIKALSMIIQ